MLGCALTGGKTGFDHLPCERAIPQDSTTLVRCFLLALFHMRVEVLAIFWTGRSSDESRRSGRGILRCFCLLAILSWHAGPCNRRCSGLLACAWRTWKLGLCLFLHATWASCYYVVASSCTTTSRVVPSTLFLFIPCCIATAFYDLDTGNSPLPSPFSH